MILADACKQTLECLSSTTHDFFLTYTTPKEVEVPKTLVAILYRFIQLVVCAYIGIYIIWFQKGYQIIDEPSGSSVIKVKGVARVTKNDLTHYVRADTGHLWDVAEYEIPPIENNAFFIATRQLLTYDQKEGYCPSSLSENLRCNISDPNSCPINFPTEIRFGFTTGKCVISPEDNSTGVCEIRAWCPEEETNSVYLEANIEDVKSFTVFIKTSVTFDLFDINLRNVRPGMDFNCRYDKNKDPYCPIISIGTMLDNLVQPTNQTALFQNGGLIEIRQDWTCNLDLNRNKCYPQHKFKVLQSGDEVPSPGINYRYGQKFRVNGTEFRTLSKVFGLRFVVVIAGKGGKFNIVNLFFAIGSGIGFMVIAGIICDFIFWHCHKSRDHYRQRKVSICEIIPKISSQENSNSNVSPRRNPTYGQS